MKTYIHEYQTVRIWKNLSLTRFGAMREFTLAIAFILAMLLPLQLKPLMYSATRFQRRGVVQRLGARRKYHGYGGQEQQRPQRRVMYFALPDLNGAAITSASFQFHVNSATNQTSKNNTNMNLVAIRARSSGRPVPQITRE